MADYKKNIQDKIKEAKLDEKAKVYVAKSKQYAEDKDLKKNASGLFGKFVEGLKRLDTIPVLTLTFVMMILIWIPMMYGSMTMSLLTGQDGMSNKELNALQQRLDERYERQLGE